VSASVFRLLFRGVRFLPPLASSVWPPDLLLFCLFSAAGRQVRAAVFLRGFSSGSDLRYRSCSAFNFSCRRTYCFILLLICRPRTARQVFVLRRLSCSQPYFYLPLSTLWLCRPKCLLPVGSLCRLFVATGVCRSVCCCRHKIFPRQSFLPVAVVLRPFCSTGV
jgi:hypothetical protein